MTQEDRMALRVLRGVGLWIVYCIIWGALSVVLMYLLEYPPQTIPKMAASCGLLMGTIWYLVNLKWMRDDE